MATHKRNYVGKDFEGSSRPYPEIRFDFVHITIVMNHTTTIRLKPLKKVTITWKLMSFTQDRQSTCTAWVETLKTRDVGRGQNIYTMSKT